MILLVIQFIAQSFNVPECCHKSVFRLDTDPHYNKNAQVSMFLLAFIQCGHTPAHT